MKFVNVVELFAKTAYRHERFNDVGKVAGNRFGACSAFVAGYSSPKSRGCRPRDSGRGLCLWQRHRQSAFLSFPRDNGGKNRYVSFAI